jgi:hypothetical protein
MTSGLIFLLCTQAIAMLGLLVNFLVLHSVMKINLSQLSRMATISFTG